MSSVREDMVASAVEFLQNPSIADAPLAKKIEFIESKGLTEEEVQAALLRVKGGNSETKTVAPVANYVPDYYYNAPPLPERDWKDYFVMATATAGVSYGIYQLVKRYVVPKIIPPSKAEIEKDKESVDQEFERVEAMLKRFEEEQRAFYEDQAAKSAKIDESLAGIEEVINRTNEKNLSNEETLKYMKLEIEQIKTTVIKNLETQKSTISSELANLDKEIGGLKRVLLKQIKEKYSPEPEASSLAAVVAKPVIPPASSVPSAREIFDKGRSGTTTPNSMTNSLTNSMSDSSQSISNSLPKTATAGIPAWQLSAQ